MVYLSLCPITYHTPCLALHTHTLPTHTHPFPPCSSFTCPTFIGFLYYVSYYGYTPHIRFGCCLAIRSVRSGLYPFVAHGLYPCLVLPPRYIIPFAYGAPVTGYVVATTPQLYADPTPVEFGLQLSVCRSILVHHEFVVTLVIIPERDLRLIYTFFCIRCVVLMPVTFCSVDSPPPLP